MITPVVLLRKGALPIVLFVLLCTGLLQAAEPGGADSGLPDGSLGPLEDSVKKLSTLMDKLAEARKNIDQQETIDLYKKVHRDFPDSPEAKQALWELAQLRKRLAIEGEAEWAEVKDAFRNYISFYPGSENGALAYYEVAVSLYKMRFHREALSYFKLCVKRFPDDTRVGLAELWQVRILIEIGRFDKAKRKVEELADHKSAQIRMRAKVRMAEIYKLNGDLYSTINIYHDLAASNPEFFIDAPEALRIFGQTNLLLGNVDKGRKQLTYYLNLAEDQAYRVDVLFLLAESYWQEKRFLAAKKLYERVLAEGDEGGRPVAFSRMRMAQYLDDSLSAPSKWGEKGGDLADPEGDKPYLEVLDHFYDDTIAQDARSSLFKRFATRGDLDNMWDYGKNYLRIARLSEITAPEKEKAGQILLGLANKLHSEKKYEELYSLYYSEHDHVKEFPNGRFLYLVGRAMEALAMYDQAAIIYYRALKWPLSEDDKIDLYYRRAQVYLTQGDLAAAERLLKYLREKYSGSKELGELMWFSGQLREAQKNKIEALSFYKQAAKIVTFPEKRAVYAGNVIRLILELNGGSAAFVEINHFKDKSFVAGTNLQQWYSRAADNLRIAGDCGEAVEVYGAALSEKLPQAGPVAQSAHLYLGDCLLDTNDRETAMLHYQKAWEGADEMLKRLAMERLNQGDIDRQMSRLKEGQGG